jgi:hypothetical protein
MKIKTKNSRQFYSQTSNNRWKWMAGATAASAVGVGACEAITIDLVNNYINGFGGNHLNADLTGDGHPDLVITNAFYRRTQTRPGTAYYRSYVGANLNGVQAGVFHSNATILETYMQLGSRYAHHYHAYYGTPSLMGSIPIFFKDLHINGGAPTRGSLEVSLFATEIQLDSLTYTSNTAVQGSTRAVPDHGSSLALLAMGAGGILALRRWRATQGHA